MPYEKGKVYKGRLAHKVGEHLSYQGAPRTKSELYELTKDQIAQLSRNLPGAPICFEHGQYGNDVLGQVTHAHLDDDNSTLMVEFELNGSTQAYMDQRLIEEGLLKELSLHHDPTDMSVLEVSLVWKGARDNTQILGVANSPGEPFQHLSPTVAASASASASSSSDTSSRCRTCLQVIAVKEAAPPPPPPSTPPVSPPDEKSPSTEGKTSAEEEEYRLLYEKVRAEVLREIEAAQVQTPVESKTPQVETTPMEVTPTSSSSSSSGAPLATPAPTNETVAASRTMVSREDALREMHYSRMTGQRGAGDPTNALNLPPGAPTGFENVDRQGAAMYQQYMHEEEAKRARAAYNHQQQLQQQQMAFPSAPSAAAATPSQPQFVPNNSGKNEQADEDMNPDKAVELILGTNTAMSKKQRMRIAEMLADQTKKLKEREEEFSKQQEELQKWHAREAETKKAMADRVISFMKTTQNLTPEREQQTRQALEQPGGMEMARTIMGSAMALMKNTRPENSSGMDTDLLGDDSVADSELEALRARLLSSSQPAPQQQMQRPTVMGSASASGWQRPQEEYKGPLPLFSRQQAQSSAPVRMNGPSTTFSSGVSDFQFAGNTIKASAAAFENGVKRVYQKTSKDYVGAGLSYHPDGRPVKFGEPGSYGWTFPPGVEGRRFPSLLTPTVSHPWANQPIKELIMPIFMQQGYERSRTDCKNGSANLNVIYDRSHPATYAANGGRARFT